MVKLPATRVDELVASGSGVRFDRGRGSPMREWVSVPVHNGDRWESLVMEALAYVSAGADSASR